MLFNTLEFLHVNKEQSVSYITVRGVSSLLCFIVLVEKLNLVAGLS